MTLHLPGQVEINRQQKVGLRIDLDACHLFDATTGTTFVTLKYASNNETSV